MILIDGGKGQLNVGKTVLTRLNLLDKLKVVNKKIADVKK